MNHWLKLMTRTSLTAAALFALADQTLAAEAASRQDPVNPFFAMDTGTRDADHQTPESQAKMLKELGYAGIGWSPGQAPEMLAALDQHGLKMFTVYIGVDIGDRGSIAGIQKLIGQLKGRDTILWLYVTSKRHKPSAVEGDAEAVPVLREIADLAQAEHLKVALYPHTWLWLERVQDAVRVAKKVDRPNLGVTFNLCHCLKVGDEPKIPDLLAQAKPHLLVVTINGTDHTGDWDRLIQPLDRGSFDVPAFLATLKRTGFIGPIGLQHYGIKGDARENLRRSLAAWRKMVDG